MSALPLVSVIISTYKRQDLLMACIASILQGDFSDFEILIIDQDPSQQLRERLLTLTDARLRYFFLAEMALDKARNLGLEHARSDIYIFADDDIEVCSNWLRAYVEAFTQTWPVAGVVAGRLLPQWLVARPTWLPADHETVFGLYDREAPLAPLPEDHLPIGANFAVHRRVIANIGRFDERLDYSYARKTNLLSGGDSLLAVRAKQAQFPLYYQPAARAWHKISSHKLSWQYFLKRTFWDGFTLLTVLHVSGQAPAANAGAVVRWHLRYIAVQWWRLFFPKQRPAPALTHPASWMRVIAHCTKSLGTIFAAVRLACTGKLP
ncbi:MAG: glycosyltransferase family 2 protein [Anaerolineales bacterium]